jgi:hypothetical protein
LHSTSKHLQELASIKTKSYRVKNISIPKPSALDPFLVTTSDEKIIGKSSSVEVQPHNSQNGALPHVEDIIPPPQLNPIKTTTSPDRLISTIADILHSASLPLDDSPFIFDMTIGAAYHNSLVLRHYDNNMKKVIDNHLHTFLAHGSEFCQIDLLEKLLMHHPSWDKFRSILTRGSSWPLCPIMDKVRIAKNNELIHRGNHKSAELYTDQLQTILKKEVAQGGMVSIPTT